MDKTDRQATIEMLVYILNKKGELSRYHLIKTLYFAHRIYLSQEGLPLIADPIVAMLHGPVPSTAYDLIKNAHELLPCDIECFKAKNIPICKAKREANLDYIALAEQEALDEAIRRYSGLSFSELRDISHDRAWQDAYQENSSAPMNSIQIAQEAGADEQTLERLETYISLCS